MEKTNDRRQIHLPQPVESKILYACHFRAFCPFPRFHLSGQLLHRCLVRIRRYAPRTGFFLCSPVLACRLRRTPFWLKHCRRRSHLFEYRMDIRLKKNLLVSLFRQTHKHSPAYFAAEMSGTVSDKILSLENSTRTIVWRLKGFLEGVIIPYAVAFPILFQINGSLALTLFVSASPCQL